MASFFYERLTAQDASFLVFETPTTHMHIGGTAVFECGPLANASGGVDIDRIRRYVGSRLHWIPRYCQKLAFIPLENHPIWVEEEYLNLTYHVRHTSLPRPGDDAQLKSLVARVMSQQLDRGKPLWELWIVEGLDRDRFAMILKTHHCVVDGMSGVDLMSVLLSPTPDTTFDEAPSYRPRRPPTTTELLAAELKRRTIGSLDLGHTLRHALEEPAATSAQVGHNLSAAWEMVRAGLKPRANTPLNRPIGAFRRFDWTSFDLTAVKRIKNALGGSVNDVVLTTIAGGIRQFLESRKVKLGRLDYRVAVPVSVRSQEEQGSSGNRVSAWFVSLPVKEADPALRFARVRAATTRLKQSKQAEAIGVFTQLAEMAAPILNLGVAFAARMNPYNLIVTNVPGPPMPLYLLGAPMVEGYPAVPLFEYQALAVALFSYEGRLFCGVNADWDLVPDLESFVSAVEQSFAELYEVATEGLPAGSDRLIASDSSPDKRKKARRSGRKPVRRPA